MGTGQSSCQLRTKTEDRTRSRLWGLGAVAAATVATLALCFILEPVADRSACEQFIAKQKKYGEGWQIDTICLTES